MGTGIGISGRTADARVLSNFMRVEGLSHCRDRLLALDHLATDFATAQELLSP